MEEGLLNENQARRLQIYFGQLLAEARDLAESLSSLPRPEPPWVSLVRADIEHLTRAVHDAVSDLELDVERKKDDPRRRVVAWAGVWWARALDCRPSALRGYGPVDPGLERNLAPAIEEIATILRRIGSHAESTVAEGSSEEGPPAQRDS
jgi:hypothetical protein